uniref:Exonuclease domain-containing protein n=1 Tax=Caenorhabditis japonica TaxID=281687 RepID=A0A8R1ETT5_CAEJA
MSFSHNQYLPNSDNRDQWDDINEKSVLVGHGLNSDLKALGIIHNRVIDTSVIYTNAGRRPSLRHLTEHLLGYKIQQNSSGHCSVEDAVAAVRLVIHGVNVPRFLAPEYQNLHMNI